MLLVVYSVIWTHVCYVDHIITTPASYSFLVHPALNLNIFLIILPSSITFSRHCFCNIASPPRPPSKPSDSVPTYPLVIQGRSNHKDATTAGIHAYIYTLPFSPNRLRLSRHACIQVSALTYLEEGFNLLCHRLYSLVPSSIVSPPTKPFNFFYSCLLLCILTISFFLGTSLLFSFFLFFS